MAWDPTPTNINKLRALAETANIRDNHHPNYSPNAVRSLEYLATTVVLPLIERIDETLYDFDQVARAIGEVSRCVATIPRQVPDAARLIEKVGKLLDESRELIVARQRIAKLEKVVEMFRSQSWFGHSGACCTFDEQGKVVVTLASCNCEPSKKAIHVELAALEEL